MFNAFRTGIAVLLTFVLCAGTASVDQCYASPRGSYREQSFSRGADGKAFEAKVRAKRDKQKKLTIAVPYDGEGKEEKAEGEGDGEEKETDFLDAALSVVALIAIYAGICFTACMIYVAWEKFRYACFLGRCNLNDDLSLRG